MLILGATGMLGHRLWLQLEDRFDCTATIRADAIPATASLILDQKRTITGLTVGDEEALDGALTSSRAQVVINCIGMVKQRPEAADPVALLRANAVFPHAVEAACARHGARLVQISTDCVFSGRRGGYAEDDLPDPADLYGRSKLAGEPEGEGTLVLRTSMIGRELERGSGLLQWFLAQGGAVSGYPNALFTGPTTPVLSRLIGDLIEGHPDLRGTFHVAAKPISKLELLELVRDGFGLETTIEPDPTVQVDRTLDGTRLREAVGWQAPGWAEMIQELADEEGEDADR